MIVNFLSDGIGFRSHFGGDVRSAKRAWPSEDLHIKCWSGSDILHVHPQKVPICATNEACVLHNHQRTQGILHLLTLEGDLSPQLEIREERRQNRHQLNR